MITWIFANWKIIAIGTLFLCVVTGTHEVDRKIYDDVLNTKIAAQLAADQTACAGAQAKTKEANDALQNDRDAIARKLAALKLQHPATCVPVIGGAQLPAGGQQHAGQNGISTDWLRDYAAECEGYRREVTTCVDFVNQTSEGVKP